MPQKEKLEKDLPESEVEKRQDKETPVYNESQQAYIGFLQQRLESAKIQKDQPYPEFNNKTYYQYYEENEKIANSFLEEKKNKDDVLINAGTIEVKLDALLSAINNLNLEPEVFAYDKDNENIVAAGVALKDIILDTQEMDGEGGDVEKKLLRQNELVKQGTVFVQEEWVKKYRTKKILAKKEYKGEFKDVKWSEKLELAFEGPTRTLLYGPNVYLGNITEYYMENQPYIFTVEYKDYETAKGIYGEFENWKYIKAGAVESTMNTDTAMQTGTVRTIYENKWRLEELSKNQVEIIKYQDKPNNEFQIIINGVLMMPIGFPLEAVSPRGEYNIAKQVNKIINAFFSYGKGFVSYGGVKQLSDLLDEMLRLAVLKTRKSFQPPYVNISNKVISSKALSPGRISMGIPPNALQVIGQEGQGVTPSEFNIINKIQMQIDENTVSKAFTGQQSRSGTTATEIIEMQKQAKLTLGLIIATTTLMEEKLAYLRLWNILENWFNPIGTKIGIANNARKLVNQFRSTTREANIEGEGLGERTITPIEQEAMPTPTEIRTVEEVEQKKKGFPVRKIFLNPDGLKDAVKTWYIEINPSQTKSSSFDKLMFREYLNDVASLAQFGSTPNIDSLEEELARNWEKSRTKVFGKGQAQEMMAAAGQQGNIGGTSKVRGRPNTGGVPQMPGGVMGE